MSEYQEINEVGFLSLLGLLFIGLKLAHVIEWSWLWVLSPFWIPVAIFILFTAFGVLAVILEYFKK